MQVTMSSTSEIVDGIYVAVRADSKSFPLSQESRIPGTERRTHPFRRCKKGLRTSCLINFHYLLRNTKRRIFPLGSKDLANIISTYHIKLNNWNCVESPITLLLYFLNNFSRLWVERIEWAISRQVKPLLAADDNTFTRSRPHTKAIILKVQCVGKEELIQFPLLMIPTNSYGNRAKGRYSAFIKDNAHLTHFACQFSQHWDLGSLSDWESGTIKSWRISNSIYNILCNSTRSIRYF